MQSSFMHHLSSVRSARVDALPDRIPRIHVEASVNDVLREFPQTAHVFNALGIDASCGGARTLADAAHEDGTDIAVLLRESGSQRQFPAWSMGYETVTDTLADDIPGYRAVFDDIDVSPAVAQPAVHQLLQWFQARVSQPA